MLSVFCKCWKCPCPEVKLVCDRNEIKSKLNFGGYCREMSCDVSFLSFIFSGSHTKGGLPKVGHQGFNVGQ